MPFRPITSLVLSACAVVLSAASGPAPRGSGDLPPARQALTFPAGTTQVRLVDLLDQLARSTGLEVTCDPRTRAQMEATLEPLESLDPVPPADVYRFVETILVQNGILFSRITEGGRPVLAVRSEQSRAEFLAPVVVDVDGLGALAAHPALLVRTLLTLENLDTRLVAQQLRPLVSGAGNAALCAALGDRGLVLQDTAPSVTALVEMLRAIDAAGGLRPTGEAPPGPR